ncbi:MAG TPA: PDZ domain-containing protein [Steroidobacteraceae bacterium]|nr:PDZ domain-containing protein [Steroidobacteraceae bacterium]
MINRSLGAWLICLLPVCVTSAVAADDPRLMLRFPTLSRTQIAFNYGGDLWVVGREGGEAHRVTSSMGSQTTPYFSPDGRWIAFSGDYDGNRDVYLVSSAGSVPRRITWHPSPDTVRGWTPDGKRVLFSSSRGFETTQDQLYTTSTDGGFPTPLPLPSAESASYSPDGSHVAYVPHFVFEPNWKRYQGGQTTPIWIADLKDSSVVVVPRDNSVDRNPMWVGEKIYFLSDRNGPVSLFAYDTQSRQVTEVLHSDGLDFKSASAGPDAIVIEQFGAIKLFDLKTGQAHTVDIRVQGDLPAVRPRYVHVKADQVQHFDFSPTGARAVFEAWGEIFSVPTDKGDIRNLTHSPAVAERDPSWSPDGKSIAYFSDASGEYALQILDQSGQKAARSISLGNPPSFFYSPRWSPDNKKIAYADKRLGLWYMDVASGAPKRIDAGMWGGFGSDDFQIAWSPDSHWLTYVKALRNGQHAVFAYSLDQGEALQLTDGLSDAQFPVFDRNGKYLYFTASTDVALTVQGLDMTSDAHPVTRSVYVIVLSREEKSPLAPQSDEDKGVSQKDADKAKSDDKDKDKDSSGSDEKGGKHARDSKHDQDSSEDKDKDKDKDNKDKEGKTPHVRIDIEGISQRILALPIPARNYADMRAGASGILFIAEAPRVIEADDFPNPAEVLHKFDLSKRKIDKFIDEINDFRVSDDGKKILYRKGEQFTVVSAEDAEASGKPKPGFGPLQLNDWQVYIEPQKMWRQIYDESFRIERDFFYDPHYHGVDLAKLKKKYEPYVAGIASRDELSYLLEEVYSELTVGHLYVRGGDRLEVRHVKVGLLGADYSLDAGRYSFEHVYDGENWNPKLQAPLTQPGVNVKAGEYLLAVNSRELHASDNLYSFFEATAGKQVVLRVGPKADGSGAREVTVVPVDDEHALRQRAWIEDNRRRVDQETGGRVAYVYVPDTGNNGFTSFNRYFFAQIGKEAVIVDERFNKGGQLADYIVDYLNRKLLNKVVTREGLDWDSPSQAIYGPKVMLINEMAGSGGDALPWYFRKMAIGALIGKRTWGGLVGIGGYPQLIDGGTITAPRAAIYGLKGEWEVENHGVAPDYEVELDPQAYRAGHDSQLDKAIQVVMQQLAEHPPAQIKRPPFPNYHPHDELGSSH